MLDWYSRVKVYVWFLCHMLQVCAPLFWQWCWAWFSSCHDNYILLPIAETLVCFRIVSSIKQHGLVCIYIGKWCHTWASIYRLKSWCCIIEDKFGYTLCLIIDYSWFSCIGKRLLKLQLVTQASAFVWSLLTGTFLTPNLVKL